MGAGGCPVVVAQWQSTGCTSQVSWVRFPVAAGLFTFLYFRLITSKLLFSDPLCFSAHSGSNLLPEPRVILDAGSLIAMVVEEVVVISGPLFGGVMAIVQLVSVTADGTQKRYDN